MKQSIVKRTKYLPEKEWSNDYGTFHVHGIVFENGDFGEYSSKDKEQTKFIAGQSSTYEMTGSPGRQKIKPVAPDQQSFVSGGPSLPKQTKDDKNRAFALSYAKDIIVAQIGHGRISHGDTTSNYTFDEMELLQLAETFNAFLNGEKKQEPIESQPIPKADPSDDLPF